MTKVYLCIDLTQDVKAGQEILIMYNEEDLDTVFPHSTESLAGHDWSHYRGSRRVNLKAGKEKVAKRKKENMNKVDYMNACKKLKGKTDNMPNMVKELR